jgi:hypothetical protein
MSRFGGANLLVRQWAAQPRRPTRWIFGHSLLENNPIRATP